MKKIFLALGLLLLTGCEKDVSTNYFYQLGWNESVNFVGKYPANAKKCAKTQCYYFSYGDEGQLNFIEHLDRGVLVKDDWLGVAKIEFRYGNKGWVRSFYNADEEPTIDNDGVHAEVLYFRPDINAWVKQHQNIKGNLVANKRGVYGYVEFLNSDGVKVFSQPLDKNFSLTTDKHGITKKTFKRNADGFVIETQNLDVSGNLINRLKDGVAVVKKEVNAFGDVTRAEFYDADENLVDEAEWKYDERGNAVDE